MERSANDGERDIFTPRSAFYLTKQPPREQRAMHYKARLSTGAGKWTFSLRIADTTPMSLSCVYWGHEHSGTLSRLLCFPTSRNILGFNFGCGRIREEKRQEENGFRAQLSPAGQSGTFLPLCKLQSSRDFPLLIA